MRLYFDTETTGFPSKILPPHHPDQSAICSIAWALVDEKWNTILEEHHFIIPDGWRIPEAQVAFHGITNEKCEAEGYHFRDVRDRFSDDMRWGRVRQACAYNIAFDEKMLWNHCARASLPPIPFASRFCVMEFATGYCQLPPTEKMLAAKRKGFKPPKLSEALKIICGEEHEGAHDALADVRATIQVHKKLMELMNDNS